MIIQVDGDLCAVQVASVSSVNAARIQWLGLRSMVTHSVRGTGLMKACRVLITFTERSR